MSIESIALDYDRLKWQYNNLRREHESLKDRLEILEQIQFEYHDQFPKNWWLTRKEAKLLSVLLKRENPTFDALMAALYSEGTSIEVDPQIMKSFICKLRKKLSYYNIKIETAWGNGYYLTKETKQLIKSYLDAEKDSSSKSHLMKKEKTT
jgi:two-component system cell cycle response regulator CtrA